tara:strand:- start:234 stop:2288 length:2055 start_codon:yes stop_codon:yes gene_type:complete
MACSDQISTTDLENASLDAKLLAEVATSRTGGVSSGALISQTSNRFGETTSTTRGQLAKIAYEPPVAYAGSIAFTVDDGAKTIERSGIIYAPLISSLPLTTTGTWSSSDEDNFYAIQAFNLFVETYGQLDAITAQTTGSVVTVTGEGISGQFVVEDGAHTANVGTIRDFNNATGTQYLQRLFGGDISAAWFGVIGDGVADDAASGQAAFNYSALTGKPIYWEPSIYRFGSVLNIAEGTKIKGAGQSARLLSAGDTYFHFDHPGVGLLLQSETTAKRGIAIDGINTYRTQPAAPAGGWAPNTYDYDIQVKGAQDVIMTNILCLNPTKGIQFLGDETETGTSNNRANLRNIKMNPYQVGFSFTHVYDVFYMDELHVWPFNGNDVSDYTRANLTAYSFGRIDNPQIGRIFSWGSNIAMHFKGQSAVGLANLPAGTINQMYIASADMDNCTRAALFDGDSSSAEVTIGRLGCASDAGFPSISAEPFINFSSVSNCRLQIDVLKAQATTGHAIDIESGAVGTNNYVTIGKYKSTNVGSGSAREFIVGASNTLELLTEPEFTAAAAYNTGGTGTIKSPDWRAYTPTVTATTGTISTSSATGRYKRQGRTIEFQATITITTNGTGAGAVRVGLPGQASITSIATGRNRSAGPNLQGIISTSSTFCSVTTYANAYPATDGYILDVNGSFEVI